MERILDIHLTSNGLLVKRMTINDSCDGFIIECFFTSNDGVFRRICTEDEFNHLVDKKELTKVDCSYNSPLGQWLLNMAIPEWKHLWDTIDQDDRQYQPGLSNNGGCYSFTTRTSYYIRNNNGRWEFCNLSTHSTSAEFSYDELSGHFQNQNMGVVDVIGMEKPFTVYTECGMDEDGYPDESPIVLDQIAIMCSYDDALYAVGSYTNDENELVEEELSIDEVESRHNILRQLGYNVPVKTRR